MKKNKNILIAILFMIAGSALTGCNKYLDVYPKSTVSESQVFDTEFGFQQALIGGYVSLSSPDLYLSNMSVGFVSAIAQDYSITINDQVPLADARRLLYTSTRVEDQLSSIWGSGYGLILGMNKVIENSVTNRHVLPDAEYARIRGEALGLRAYMHFDLLRLFGPVPGLESGEPAIPYVTTTHHFATVPMPFDEVMGNILDDIEEAAELLRPVDSIFNGGIAVYERRSKINYYALKGLEARVRLYAGDRPGAFAAAQEVVNAELFPFADPAGTTHSDQARRDRLFLSEIVFGARTPVIQTQMDTYFKYRFAGYGTSLNRQIGDINLMYENSATDIRRVFGFEIMFDGYFPTKFWQSNTLQLNGTAMGPTSPERLDQIIPLIRISEMYYIMAETAASPQQGAAYLDLVREARGLLPLDQATITDGVLQEEVLKEYRKELYAEGQVFYLYKRKMLPRLPFMTEDIDPGTYQLPMPLDELEFNPNY